MKSFFRCVLCMILVSIVLLNERVLVGQKNLGYRMCSPKQAPGHRGPAIGIEVSSYANRGVKGVLVKKDNSKRDLWYMNLNNKRQAARFVNSRDVILKVNNKPVYKASDVLASTRSNWNKLTIRDLGTGITADYYVRLP